VDNDYLQLSSIDGKELLNFTLHNLKIGESSGRMYGLGQAQLDSVDYPLLNNGLYTLLYSVSPRLLSSRVSMNTMGIYEDDKQKIHKMYLMSADDASFTIYEFDTQKADSVTTYQYWMQKGVIQDTCTMQVLNQKSILLTCRQINDKVRHSSIEEHDIISQIRKRELYDTANHEDNTQNDLVM